MCVRACEHVCLRVWHGCTHVQIVCAHVWMVWGADGPQHAHTDTPCTLDSHATGPKSSVAGVRLAIGGCVSIIVV